MNSLRCTIFESCNFMAYFGRSISSLSRDMPSKVFGLTSLGPPLDMVEMRRIPPSGSQTGGPLLVKQLGVTVVVLDLENVLVDVA